MEFIFRNEVKKDLGEDQVISIGGDSKSFPYCVAVFDGLGGLGASMIKIDEEKTVTDAYLAAYCYSKIVEEFILSNQIDENAINKFKQSLEVESAEEIELLDTEKVELTCILESFLTDWTSKLKSEIANGIKLMSEIEEYNKKRVSEKFELSFPSTMALIYVVEIFGLTYAVFVWCGDSRCYILDNTGLHQVSKDDAKVDVDAMEDLLSSAPIPMNNRLGVDKIGVNSKLRFQTQLLELGRKCLLVCASDGCYGYEETPMHFENILLFYLQKSSNFDEYINKIKDYYAKRMYDDTSMGVIPFGFSFDRYGTVKDYFAPRAQSIALDYLMPIENLKNDYQESKNIFDSMTKEGLSRIDASIIDKCRDFEDELKAWILSECRKRIRRRNKNVYLEDNNKSASSPIVEEFLENMQKRIQSYEKADESEVLNAIDKNIEKQNIYFWCQYLQQKQNNYATRIYHSTPRQNMSHVFRPKPEQIQAFYDFLMTNKRFPHYDFTRSNSGVEIYYFNAEEVWGKPSRLVDVEYICCDIELYHYILDLTKKRRKFSELFTVCFSELYSINQTRLKEAYIESFNEHRPFFDSKSVMNFIDKFNKSILRNNEEHSAKVQKLFELYCNGKIELWKKYQLEYEKYLAPKGTDSLDGKGY